MHPEVLNEEERRIRKIEDYDTEDSYMKNYDKKAKSNASGKKAYVLRGEKIKLGAISAIHEIMDLEALKQESKKQGATITQYLTAVLMYSIYQENYRKAKGKRPIKICIPVNLKKYFPSATSSNSFSYIDIKVNTNKISKYEDILEEVKKQFVEKLTEEELLKTIAVNLKLSNNPILKFVPLFIKKAVVVLAHREMRKNNTTTLSNIGRIGIIAEYKPYIDRFLLLIAPESVEKIKCTICAYEDNMVFSFASVIEDKDVENKLKEILENQGIVVQLDGNEV